MDMDRVTHAFLKVRQARRDLATAYKLADLELRDKQERLEAGMLAFLNEHGINSAPSMHGVFFKQLDIIPQADDWDRFYRWIAETDGFEFLERRIKKTTVRDYMNAHRGAMPPGVSVFSKYVVHVRRSTKDGSNEEEGDE